MQDWDKNEIRTEMKALRNALGPSERAAAESAVLANLRASGALEGLEGVLVYSSFGGELGTSRIKSALFAEHCRVAVPVMREGEMRAALVVPDTPTRKGRFMIEEPEEPVWADRQSIRAVLVPGLAFDREGRRIGYGMGCYDKFLRGISPLLIGICYDFQLLERLPQEAHDIPMNLIVTDERVVRIEGRIG